MPKSTPIFYSALLLTGVNLLLRFVGTTFQVYISSVLGANGVGLLQLVLSVGSFAMVAAMGGVRTATMYLTAEELGRKNERNVTWVISGCIGYSIVCSCAVSAVLYWLSPMIAQDWIGDLRTVAALRLLAVFLPVNCLCGVMTGYFTAANKIRLLAAVEAAEQLFTIAVTMAALVGWAGTDTEKACLCVIAGSCCGGCLTLISLTFLRIRQKPDTGPRIPVRSRLARSALPLALGDILKAGINTAENLMVPLRLSKNGHIADPLAAFGTVSGMVFPVVMFPACILFGLGELLIPELARCSAARSRKRICYLVQRSLQVAMLYGALFGGMLYLLADPLCLKLYSSTEAAPQLRLYALLVPVLYCDAVTDAMTKGLGQQKICVRYNILTAALDVLFLYFLLPEYGMLGYFASFLVTHLLNFALSLKRLLKITGQTIPCYIPVLTAAAALAAVGTASLLTQPLLRAGAYALILGCSLYLLRVVKFEDLLWLKQLIRKNDLTKP